MDSFFDDKISDRLGGTSFGKSTQIYKFELIKRAKAVAKKANPEIELIIRFQFQCDEITA